MLNLLLALNPHLEGPELAGMLWTLDPKELERPQLYKKGQLGDIRPTGNGVAHRQAANRPRRAGP